MQALPAAPAPPPRRQVFVGTALAGVAMLMVTGGMLGIWILMRERAFEAEGTWVPEGITIPEVAVQRDADRRARPPPLRSVGALRGASR